MNAEVEIVIIERHANEQPLSEFGIDEIDIAYQRLAFHVLRQAYKDADATRPLGQYERRNRREYVFRAELRAWVQGDDFAFWCDVAGIEADIARDHYLARIDATARAKSNGYIDSVRTHREAPADVVLREILNPSHIHSTEGIE